MKHSGKIAEKRVVFTSTEQIDLAEVDLLCMFGTNDGTSGVSFRMGGDSRFR